jgi:hypothetical protein
MKDLLGIMAMVSIFEENGYSERNMPVEDHGQESSTDLVKLG